MEQHGTDSAPPGPGEGTVLGSNSAKGRASPWGAVGSRGGGSGARSPGGTLRTLISPWVFHVVKVCSVSRTASVIWVDNPNLLLLSSPGRAVELVARDRAAALISRARVRSANRPRRQVKHGGDNTGSYGIAFSSGSLKVRLLRQCVRSSRGNLALAIRMAVRVSGVAAAICSLKTTASDREPQFPIASAA